MTAPINMKDADDELKRLLKKFLGNDADNWQDVINEGRIAEIPFNNKSNEKVLSELSNEGFFTMAYPHIFVNGSCDITIKKIRSIDYLQWVEHIYFTTDNRVAAHPFVKFQLVNIGLKKRALNQGSYLVSLQLKEALLTVDELKENLNNDDDSVPRKIISFAGSLPNTGPYWRERKKELDSLHFFLIKEYQVMPTYFDTSSSAEHHWTPLRQLLIKYYAAVTKPSEGDIFMLFFTDSAFKHKLLQQNSHIVTGYFNARHINFQNTVLEELFDFQEFWGHSEFAKSRGQIHDQNEFFSKKQYEKIKNIMDNRTMTNIEKTDMLEKWFQTDSQNEEFCIYAPW